MTPPRLVRGVLALCLLQGLVGAPAAHAANDFTFYGSGWGHGIGMSQYGAYGLAGEGWDARSILKHYYRGISIGSRTAPARKLRIGLVQSAHRLTFEAAEGGFTLRLKSGRTVGRVPQGSSRIVTIEGGRYRVARPGRTGRLRGSSRNPLVVRRQRGAKVRVPQWGYAVMRGRLEVAIAGSSRAHLVAVLRPEMYLRGLAEVPSSWPTAALQAQAIAGRTYAFRKVAAADNQRQDGCACGLYGSTRDQFYGGASKEEGSSGNRWRAAVEATRGLVATYDGKLIATYYSSSSGGFTENIENVWTSSDPKPYLKGVCDPGDYVESNGNRSWSESLSPSAVTKRLKSLTGNIGTVTGFSDYALGISGRVRSVRVNGTGGSKVVKGWDLRGELGLKDTRFRVDSNRNVTGRIRQGYDALDCQPGRATGAQNEVANGRYQDFQDGRIYLNRTDDRVVWLHGPVHDHYLAMGAHGSTLGLPVKLEPSAGGWLGTFQHGTITCPSGGACTAATS